LNGGFVCLWLVSLFAAAAPLSGFIMADATSWRDRGRIPAD